jgi:hypothetical protein
MRNKPGRFIPATPAQKAAFEARRRAFAARDSSRRFPLITRSLADQVALVAPSFPLPGVEFRPSCVTLHSGETHERVLVVDADMYKAYGGLWPDANVPWDPDAHRRLLAIADVTAIAESSYRLPAEMATKVWDAGERFGTYTFTLVLADGTHLPYAVTLPDFPRFPSGVHTSDCAAVIADEFPEAFKSRQPTEFEVSAPYVWCLYRRDRSGPPD